MILYLTNAFGNSLGWPRVADPVIEAAVIDFIHRLIDRMGGGGEQLHLLSGAGDEVVDAECFEVLIPLP